jgi:GxxExxY protein
VREEEAGSPRDLRGRAESAERPPDERTLNTWSGYVIAAAINVHRDLGPGLLESVYERCLEAELQSMGQEVERQKRMPIVYRGRVLERAFRIDLLVNDAVIVEVKSVEKVEAVHDAQTLSYLKLSARRVALRINFNVVILIKGLRRFVNGLPDP